MPFSDFDFSTWQQIFRALIQEEKPRANWTLQLDKDIEPDNTALGWRQYQQTAHARFQCSICNRGWISAQVKILCHMYQEPGKSQGRVLMRIFGQRCQRCSWSRFEKPEFSTESIQSVLKNLVNYILQRYHGHGFRKIPSTSNAALDNKVLLDGPHDTGNCEACALSPSGGCAFKHKAKLPRSASPSPKSHGSSPPKNHHSSPQTGNVYFENRSFQELREPQERGFPLLMVLSLAALAFISHFIR